MEEEQQLRMSQEEIDLLIDREMDEDNIEVNAFNFQNLTPQRKARLHWVKMILQGIPNEQLTQLNSELRNVEQMKNETMTGIENQLIRNPNYNISEEELETLSSLEELKKEIIEQANTLAKKVRKKTIIAGKILQQREEFAEQRAVFQIEKRAMKPEGRLDEVFQEPNNPLNRVSRSRVIPKDILKVNRDEMAIFKPMTAEEFQASVEREQKSRRAMGLD